MALIDTGLKDYFMLNKISMSNWRIADVDHFMRGNSFFNRMIAETEWYSDVEKVIGPQSQNEMEVKDLETLKEVQNMTEIYQKYLNLKEPRSNRGLEIFKTQEEMDAEKKAAKERAEAKIQEKKAASAAAAGGNKTEEKKKGDKKKPAEAPQQKEAAAK
jgi:hypothetical protein